MQAAECTQSGSLKRLPSNFSLTTKHKLENGKVGDLVKVKDGFARNFLFPQKKALRKNKKNMEYFEDLKEEIAIKEKKAKEEAENILKSLENIKIEFQKKADEKDQLYGSVSVKEITKLEEQIQLSFETPIDYMVG